MKVNPNQGPKPAPQVRIRELNDDAEPVDVATVGLRADGKAVTEHEQLMKDWEKLGILGRPESGRVFPQDGAKFLDELPYMYRSVYFWAEKTGGANPGA